MHWKSLIQYRAMLALCCLAKMLPVGQASSTQAVANDGEGEPLPSILGWHASYSLYRNGGPADLSPSAIQPFERSSSPLATGEKMSFNESASGDLANLSIEMNGQGEDYTIHISGKVSGISKKGGGLSERKLDPIAIFQIYTVGQPLSVRGYASIRGTLTSKASSQGGGAVAYAHSYDSKLNTVETNADVHQGTKQAPRYSFNEDIPCVWDADRPSSLEGGFGIDPFPSSVGFQRESYQPSIDFRMPRLTTSAESSNGGSAETTFDITAKVHLVVKGTWLRSVPRIMRARGWHYGPLLLDRWFEASGNKAKIKDPVTGNKIQYDWALPVVSPPGFDIPFTRGFPSADEEYRRITSKPFWDGYTRVGNIIMDRHRAQALKLAPGQRLAFGGDPNPDHFRSRLEDFHKKQIGYVSVNSRWQYAKSLSQGLPPSHADVISTLGSFDYYAIPKGYLKRAGRGKGFDIEITEVAVYVIDSYDFNGGQDFLHWRMPDYVGNSDRRTVHANDGAFSHYRDVHQKGGDFLLFVPPKTVPLPVPATIHINA